MLDYLSAAIASFASVEVLLALIVGVVGGMVIGIIPGLGPSVGLMFSRQENIRLILPSAGAKRIRQTAPMIPPTTGVSRFTFGQLWLEDGLDSTPILIGLFSISQVLA